MSIFTPFQQLSENTKLIPRPVIYPVLSSAYVSSGRSGSRATLVS